MTDQEKMALLEKITRENPVAAQMLEIMRNGMRDFVKEAVEAGAVEINGVEIARRSK